jgi:hypothetical protein
MQSSSYYKQAVEELKAIKAQVQGVLGQFDSCESVLTKSKKYIEEITINGEAIDQGKLGEVTNILKNAESDLQTIINECNAKIEDYSALYRQALAAEEAARRAAEAARRAAEEARRAASSTSNRTNRR